MPGQAQFDAPDTLHHVILRGLDRVQIVADARDHAAFVARAGEVAAAIGSTLCARALLPNHAHLLRWRGSPGLPPCMRRLLTCFALPYNRRRRRVGHLFQNRYKSIVCQEDAYFRESGRCLHLNNEGRCSFGGLTQCACPRSPSPPGSGADARAATRYQESATSCPSRQMTRRSWPLGTP
jgi:hypothetical protein